MVKKRRGFFQPSELWDSFFGTVLLGVLAQDAFRTAFLKGRFRYRQLMVGLRKWQINEVDCGRPLASHSLVAL